MLGCFTHFFLGIAQLGNHEKYVFCTCSLWYVAFLILKLELEAWLCVGWKSIKMVRLSVEQRERAIGLVEGVTSFTQERLKSMQ